MSSASRPDTASKDPASPFPPWAGFGVRCASCLPHPAVDKAPAWAPPFRRSPQKSPRPRLGKEPVTCHGAGGDRDTPPPAAVPDCPQTEAPRWQAGDCCGRAGEESEVWKGAERIFSSYLKLGKAAEELPSEASQRPRSHQKMRPRVLALIVFFLLGRERAAGWKVSFGKEGNSAGARFAGLPLAKPTP